MRYVHPDQSDVLEIAQAVRQARSKAAAEVPTVFPTVEKPQTQQARKM